MDISMNEEISSFDKYGIEDYFTDIVCASNESCLDSVNEKSLHLAVVDEKLLEKVADKMEYTACIVVVSDKTKFTLKGYKSLLVGLSKEGNVFLLSRNVIVSLFPDLKLRKIDFIIKEVVEKLYDDLDFIFFGSFKKELKYLYSYMRDKRFKIMMPVDEALAKELSNANILYDAKNRYNEQQQLF